MKAAIVRVNIQMKQKRIKTYYFTEGSPKQQTIVKMIVYVDRKRSKIWFFFAF